MIKINQMGLERLTQEVDRLKAFAEHQIRLVLDFERSHPAVMEGNRAMALPMVRRCNWYVECLDFTEKELCVTICFTGYENNNFVHIPAYDMDWFNRRIQSYLRAYEERLAQREQHRQDKIKEELATYAILKAKYEQGENSPC